MTDLLILTILSGIAVTYSIELIDLLTKGFLGTPKLNKWFSLPLSFGAIYSQTHLTIHMVVAVPAATFVAIALSKYLNKPAVITRQLPRL